MSRGFGRQAGWAAARHARAGAARGARPARSVDPQPQCVLAAWGVPQQGIVGVQTRRLEGLSTPCQRPRAAERCDCCRRETAHRRQLMCAASQHSPSGLPPTPPPHPHTWCLMPCLHEPRASTPCPVALRFPPLLACVLWPATACMPPKDRYSLAPLVTCSAVGWGLQPWECEEHGQRWHRMRRGGAGRPVGA